MILTGWNHKKQYGASPILFPKSQAWVISGVLGIMWYMPCSPTEAEAIDHAMIIRRRGKDCTFHYQFAIASCSTCSVPRTVALSSRTVIIPLGSFVENLEGPNIYRARWKFDKLERAFDRYSTKLHCHRLSAVTRASRFGAPSCRCHPHRACRNLPVRGCASRAMRDRHFQLKAPLLLLSPNRPRPLLRKSLEPRPWLLRRVQGDACIHRRNGRHVVHKSCGGGDAEACGGSTAGMNVERLVLHQVGTGAWLMCSASVALF